MPDVTIIMPSELFESSTSQVETGAEMRLPVGESVITNLHCRDDDGNELPKMNPIENVNFHLITYGENGDDYELHSSTPVIVKVGAFDYTRRMENIDERLAAIGETIRKLLGLEPDSIGITFGHVRQKPRPCWVKI